MYIYIYVLMYQYIYIYIHIWAQVFGFRCTILSRFWTMPRSLATRRIFWLLRAAPSSILHPATASFLFGSRRPCPPSRTTRQFLAGAPPVPRCVLISHKVFVITKVNSDTNPSISCLHQ